MGSDTIDTITALVQMGTNLGVLGIIFWLFVTGKLHSSTEYDELREDLETERKAHDMTRQALSLSNERAGTSILTNQLILRALNPEKKSED